MFVPLYYRHHVPCGGHVCAVGDGPYCPCVFAPVGIMYPVEAMRAQWVTDRPLRLTYTGVHLYGMRVAAISVLLFAFSEGFKV